MNNFDLNNIYMWRITKIPPTAEAQKEALLKELQTMNRRKAKLKSNMFTDRHISLILFDIKNNKNINLYDIEEAFKGKKSLLKQLEAEAEEQETTVIKLISKYDNIKIAVRLSYYYENWTD